MNLDDVKRLVAQGEGLTIEFKRKVPQAERIAKELIALANTEGGHVFFGVDDDGTITGVKDAVEEEYALLEAINQRCVPPLSFELERVFVKGRRDVLVLFISKSPKRPHYLVHEDGQRVAYLRVDEMSVEASKEAIRIMKAERDPTDTSFRFGDNELKLMRYLDAYGRITVDQYADLAGIPRKVASQTLVLMVRARVLDFHANDRQDFFTTAVAGTSAS
jgi:hypothetical protein